MGSLAGQQVIEPFESVDVDGLDSAGKVDRQLLCQGDRVPGAFGSERRVAGWVDRRASAIRIRLAADAERRLVYLIEVPERASEALRTALQSFEGVEERPAEEVLGGGESESDSEAEEVKRAVLRTELVLARPSVEPLRTERS